jgi:Chlorite dismutase
MHPNALNPRLFSFIGGHTGPWRVMEVSAVRGAGLTTTSCLTYQLGDFASNPPPGASWVLRGATSNERYVTRTEKDQLTALQEGLGRPQADCAVLIPIKKSTAWWQLTQGERRRIFEEQSHHTQIGLGYLPHIARRLHHCRDLSTEEPFDFLTWFEFAEKDTAAFDEMLQKLRATDEWHYIERECEVRLKRNETFTSD